jgi:hypothetical protein
MEIEKGIPLPAKQSVKNGFYAVARSMEAGDSVFLADCKGGWLSTAKRAAPGAVFTTRKETKDGIDGLRLWRVS